MIGERAPERRRLQRPPPFDEKRFAQALFEHGNGARDRRLRQSEQRCPFGDTAGFHDRSELNKMAFVYLHNN